MNETFGFSGHKIDHNHHPEGVIRFGLDFGWIG
jgi:hypothetical protein